MSVTRKRAIAPIVIGVLGTAILLMLGAWQVQRLEWKEGLIAEIEQRMAAAPVALPASPDPSREHMMRVRIEGVLEQQELHAIHSIKRTGPGYRMIVPMDLGDRRIMVDLGFILEAKKDAVPREGSVRWADADRQDEVVGLLAWPKETDSFTPEPDRGRNIWFARDVSKMAEAMDTEPLLVIAEIHPDQKIVLPQPPGVDLPNRHLEYALTWFGLALVWSIMSIVWLRSEMRRVPD
ncbi:MAG: SURF1 family protein [Pseudomonadota bacterium]